MSPRRSLAAAALALAVALAGCGGGGGGASNAVRSAGDDIARLSRGADPNDFAAARSGLTQLRQQDEAVEAALASAFCEGATSIVNTGELPTGADWGEFLVGEVESQVTGVSHDVVQDKVEQFVAAAELSQMSGAAAVRYAQICGPRL